MVTVVPTLPHAVPEPEVVLPTSVPPASRPNAYTQTVVHFRSKRINDIVTGWEQQGYNLSWAGSYKVGQTPKAYYSLVFHNSTVLKTRGFVELKPTSLDMKIEEMKADGYSLRYLSCRMQRATPYRRLYAAVFEQLPDIIETEVYLRDSMDTYHARLKEKKEAGYQLVSHCFAHIPEDGSVEVSSVYTRDRRVAFNITAPPPLQWKSYYNLSFYDYTEVALTLANENMYLTFLDIWNYEGDVIDPESFFACVFTEHVDNSEWFRWGMNTTATRALVEESRGSWDPVIITGYSYQSQLSHYAQFKRKVRY